MDQWQTGLHGRVLTASAFAVLLLLAGCGQRGNLILPEKPPATPAEAQASAPVR